MPIRFLILSKPYGRSSNIYGNIIGMPIFFDNLSTNRHLIYIYSTVSTKKIEIPKLQK